MGAASLPGMGATSLATIANKNCSANTIGLSNGVVTEISEGRLASFTNSEFPSSVLVSILKVTGVSDSAVTVVRGCLTFDFCSFRYTSWSLSL